MMGFDGGTIHAAGRADNAGFQEKQMALHPSEGH
jgi:hypothetical protein